MFLMKYICLFVSLTSIVYSILQPSDVLNTQHNKRNKRLIDFKNLEEISVEEHEKKYPFIVGIKTVQNRRAKRVRIRCTGTLLDPHLVLTTGHCVLNPTFIVVFRLDNFLDRKYNNKGVNVQIRQNLTWNNVSDPDGLQRFPNPLFYGYMINKEHKWISSDPMEETGRFPLRNLAIIHLDNPLYPYDSNINYPVIDMNPAHFTRKYVDADMFGWCQYENDTVGEKPKSEPRLTKTTIKVTYCEDLNGLNATHNNNSSPGLSSSTFLLCTDRKFNDGRYCDLDHGGPVIVWESKATEAPPVRPHEPTTPESSRNLNTTNESTAEFEPPTVVPWTKQPLPRLIAIINRPRWYGGIKTSPENEQLLYLWQYADWIHSMMDEFLATPTPMSPCATSEIVATASTVDSDAWAKRMHIESYYDFEVRMEPHVLSVDPACESTDSPAATRRPSALICTLVLVAATAVSSQWRYNA